MYPILEAEGHAANSGAERSRHFAWRESVAAGSGVDTGVGQILPAATAPIGLPCLNEPFTALSVSFVPGTLEKNRFISNHAETGQIRENVFGAAGNFSWWINILDPNQPYPAGFSRL